jgi:hypothetical protein
VKCAVGWCRVTLLLRCLCFWKAARAKHACPRTLYVGEREHLLIYCAWLRAFWASSSFVWGAATANCFGTLQLPLPCRLLLLLTVDASPNCNESPALLWQ